MGEAVVGTTWHDLAMERGGSVDVGMALFGLSGVQWLDDSPDVTCKDSMGQHAVEVGDCPVMSTSLRIWRLGVRIPRGAPL
jgi:hypothetical protein